MSARHVAIVGAGASGTLQALHLLREGAKRVTLIEREREPARGTAYGTKRPEHLLNVTAHRMSVWPDDPEQFARWFGALGGAADDYAPRMLFGDYLAELMAGAGDRLEIVAGEAVAIEAAEGGERVRLADGRSLDADAAVLALGNLRPAPVRGIEPARLGAVYVDDPWYGGFTEGLTESDTVLLVGTALTAIDAALTLDATGFRGRILAVSRRGLAPRPHLRREPVVGGPAEFPRSCVALLRAVRRRAREIGWREAVHELRPVTQQVWGDLPLAERRRFVRHLRPWWDVHRHRIAPAVADRIAAMQAEGRLRFAAGRIVSAEADGDGALVSWRPRGSEATEQIRVRRILGCSGPEIDIGRAGEPLLEFAARRRPDPAGRLPARNRRRPREPGDRPKRLAFRPSFGDRPDDPRRLLGDDRRLRHRGPGAGRGAAAGSLDQDSEQGAALLAVGDADRAAMGEHDLAGEAEPDSGALRLGGEEGQEDVLAQALGDALAIVLDLDLGAAGAGAPERQRDVRALRMLARRLGGVAQQVDQHLAHQIGVGVERSRDRRPCAG